MKNCIKYVYRHTYHVTPCLQKKSFSFQIQIIAYNSDLYSSYAEAENSPRGLAGLAMFTKVWVLWVSLEIQLPGECHYLWTRESPKAYVANF